MPASIAILLSRVRLPSVAAVLGLTIACRFLPVLPHGWLVWLADLALAAVLLRVGTLRREPVAVRSPVQGSWRALNSPATRVPSHGIQGYGQTYAIDLVYDPAGPVQSRGRASPGGRSPGAHKTFPDSASRSSPRPTGWWCASTTASGITGAAPYPSGCSTCSPSSCSVSCSGPAGWWATT